jgi:hypothetical protein
LYTREDHVHPVDTSRAPLVSPVFTGTPAAPTQTVGNNTTAIATTAFVAAAVPPPATVAPLMNGGSALVGGATKYAREDHVHQSDTAKLSVAGGTMNGVLTLASGVVCGSTLAPTSLDLTKHLSLFSFTYGLNVVSGNLQVVVSATLSASFSTTGMQGAVGATTPNTGAFTTLSASGAVTGAGFAAYAKLASPVFTGDPQAPTPTAGDNDTSIATTAFVTTAAAAKVSKAGDTMSGLLTIKYATSTLVVGDDTNLSTTGQNGIRLQAYTDGNVYSDYKTFAGGTISFRCGAGATTGSTFNFMTVDPSTGKISLVGDPTSALHAVTKQYTDARVLKAGDTMTGNLAIAKAAPQLILNSTDGNNSVIGAKNGLNRWTIFLGDGNAESTGNAGTNFGIMASNDAGAGLSVPIQITRSNGNVGIWTANPGSRLDVAGDINISGVAYKPGGGTWTAPSDARIKDVIGDYTHGLAEVLRLEPVRYTFKGNYSKLKLPDDEPSPHQQLAEEKKEFVGLIAQQAEVPMPEMVTTEAGYIDGDPVDDMRVLDTTALLFALVNSVKELSDRIEALEGRQHK